MAYPLEFRRLVVDAYLRGEGSLTDLAEAYGIRVPTRHAWVRRAQATGDLQPRRPPGRPSKLDARAQAVLRERVVQDNDATLAMLARALETEAGVRVSTWTVGRGLARLDVTRKKSRSTRRSAAAYGSRGSGRGFSHGSPASTPRASFSSMNSASISR
jgi:transposase